MRKGWGRLFLYGLSLLPTAQLGRAYKQANKQRMTIFTSKWATRCWVENQMISNDLFDLYIMFFSYNTPPFLISLPVFWYSCLFHSWRSPRWTKEDFASPLMLLDWKGWETTHWLVFGFSLGTQWLLIIFLLYSTDIVGLRCTGMYPDMNYVSGCYRSMCANDHGFPKQFFVESCRHGRGTSLNHTCFFPDFSAVSGYGGLGVPSNSDDVDDQWMVRMEGKWMGPWEFLAPKKLGKTGAGRWVAVQDGHFPLHKREKEYF